MLAKKILSSPPNDSGASDDEIAVRVAHLLKVSLFSDIHADPDAMQKLAGIFEDRSYAADAAIIKEGEMGSEVYLLTRGEASVFRSTAEGDLYKVAILKGDQHAFFGEGGLLDSDARSATIKADSPCHCLVLSREAFEKFGSEHPHWALPILRKIARVVMGRLRKTNNDVMLLYNALVAEIRGH